jgi:hypothetical protein
MPDYVTPGERSAGRCPAIAERQGNHKSLPVIKIIFTRLVRLDGMRLKT